MKLPKPSSPGLPGWILCAVLLTAAQPAVFSAGEKKPPASPGAPKENGSKGKDAKNGAKPAGASPAASQQVQDSAQGLGSFGKVLPVGQKNRDVKIPSFRDGNPSSFIKAATMTRLDDERMDMEKLDIRMYGLTEEKDLRIMMPTAVYHMPTEVISSSDRSRISRKDFDLQGDTLIFDTRTQQGKMTGHIHMVIHDADSFKQQPDKPAPASGGTTRPAKTSDKAEAPSSGKK